MSPKNHAKNTPIVHFESIEPRILLSTTVSTVTMPYDGYLSAGVYDQNGQLVRTLLEMAPEQQGAVTLTWDGKNNLNQTVSQNGTYTWKALASQVNTVDQSNVGNSVYYDGHNYSDVEGYNLESLAVSNVGGTNGDVGGTIAENAHDTFYGDTTLSQSYTLANAISASGRLLVQDVEGFKGAFYIGHLSQSTASGHQEFIGLEFMYMGGSTSNISVRARVMPNGDYGVAGGVTPPLDFYSGYYNWSYSYDPSVGPYGTISYTITNDAGTVNYSESVPLTSSCRNASATFDAFGIGTSPAEMYNPIDNPNSTTKAFIDNVTYTGNTGTETFETDPTSRGWTGSGNTSYGSNFHWNQYQNADGGLYTVSANEEGNEQYKINSDGSTAWTLSSYENYGVAADDTYNYVSRHVSTSTGSQDWVYRYYNRNGGLAPFAPGVDHIVVNDAANATDPRPASESGVMWTPDQWNTQHPLWGMAADGYRLYVSDYRHNRVLVYDRNTGNLLCDTSTLTGPTLTLTKPLGVAVQTGSTSNAATIWVAVGNRTSANDGSVMKLTWNGTRLVDSGTAITGLANPSGLAYGGPNNHLFVTDTNNCQIREYSVSSTPALAGLGVFGSKHVGMAPLTDSSFYFWNTYGAIAIDPNGILSVMDDMRIQRFYTTGPNVGQLYQSRTGAIGGGDTTQTWGYEANGMHFVMEGRLIYQVDPDYTGGPRIGWQGDGSWRLYSRVYPATGFGPYANSGGTSLLRTISDGQTQHSFLYTFEGGGIGVSVYALEPAGPRLCAVVGTGWTGTDFLANQMANGGWNGQYVWTDTDGDGQIDWNGTGSGANDGEVNWAVPLGSFATDSVLTVDSAGTIWTQSYGNIYKVPLQGFDAQGNPMYNWSDKTLFYTLSQASPNLGLLPTSIRVAGSGDVYVMGQCQQANVIGTPWVTKGNFVAHFNSSGQLLSLQPTSDQYYGAMAIDDADPTPDYYFVGEPNWDGNMVKMFSNDGLLVAKTQLGAASGYNSGWIDTENGLDAFTNPLTGETYIYGETCVYGGAERYRVYGLDTIQRFQGTFTYTADTSLVDHYEFSSNLADTAGTNGATFYDGTTATAGNFAAGKIGNAVSLDGVNDYVSVPHPVNQDAYTISLWVKPTTVSSVNIETGYSSIGWGGFANQLWITSDGHFAHSTRDSLTTKTVKGSTVAQANTWYFLTITASEGGMMRLYVNGVEEGTAQPITGKLWLYTDQYEIGQAFTYYGFGAYGGLVDDFRVYNNALSSSDISTLYGMTDKPTVSVAATDATASEYTTDPGTFVVSRDNANGNLTVYYTSNTGTATPGSDFSSLTGSVVIANGQTSATVMVSPIDDAAVEGNETAILALTGNGSYTVGSASSAAITIVDNDGTSTVNPTGRWGFDDNLADSVGNNDATYFGAGPLGYGKDDVYTGGQIGDAVNMSGRKYYPFIDGTPGDYAETPYATDASAYTIIAWVKPTTVSMVNIIGRTNSSGTVAIASEDLRINASGKFEHSTYDGTYHTVTGTTTVQANTWYQVAIVGTSGGTMRLYVNGVEEGTATSIGTLWTGGDRFQIGNQAYGGMDFYKGLMDDVQIFDAPLTASQIQTLYTANYVSVKATDPNAAEQAADTGTFTISRTGITGNLTVYYTVGGTATSGADFAALSGSAVIPAGSTSATVTVTPIDDNVAESREYVTLTLSANANYAVAATADAQVYIADNEPVVSILPPTTTMSEQGPTGASFTVLRTTSSGTLTVYYTVGGTASSSDYTALSGSVVIANGQTSAAVAVTPVDDSVVDPGEGVVLSLSPNANYTVGVASSASTPITDNEPVISIVASDPNAAEQGTDPGVFTITRNNTSGNLTVNYTVSGTATSGSDYTALSGSVVISNGQSSAIVTVAPIDDAVVDIPTETVILTLNTSTSYRVSSQNTATVGILDNEVNPNVITFIKYDLTTKGTWKGVYGADGYNVIGNADNPPSGVSVSTYAGVWTWDASNTTDTRDLQKANPASDRIAACWGSGNNTWSFTVTLGSTTRQLAIYMLDWEAAGRQSHLDVTDGTNNLDSRTISNYSNGTYLVYQGKGTLTFTFTDIAANSVVSGLFFDPIAMPAVSVNATDPNAAEQGQDPAVFTFTRSGSTAGNLTVYYTAGGTATNTTDYSTLSGSVVIPSGSATATITATPIDDAVAEGNENVLLTVSSNANYNVGTPSSASATIVDNEASVTIAATDANAAEPSDTGTFTVTRTTTSGNLTVYYSVSGTATGGTDYSTLSGSVVITSGQSSATVTVTPIDDSVFEDTESVTATLTANSAYSIGASDYATVNIADNEVFPSVSVTATSPNAAEPSTTGTFTVTRTTSAGALTVYYTVGGTATSASDYSALAGSVVIANGQTSATVTVTPINDTLYEPTESVILTLSTNSNYNIGTQNTATVNIADNEATVSITATANAAEPSTNGTFTVTRSNTNNGALTVYYTVSGTATSGSDFSALSGSVVIASGQTSATVTVTTIDDSLVEGTESVIATLSSNANYGVGTPSSATVQIADNEVAGNSAAFLNFDTTTVGTWKGVYGSTGYNVFLNSSSYPSGVSVSFANYGAWTWFDPTSDVRGLQKADPAQDRLAACYYNGVNTPWTMTVNAGSTTQQIAIYGVDWGNQGCVTKIEAMDGSTVLNTQTFSGGNYYGGEYAVYRITGTVTFRFTALGGTGSAISGIFFDPGFTQPSVSIAATNPNASEPSTTGTFMVTRSNNSGSLTVNYTVGGTATNGTDYSTLSGSVVIASGQTSAAITVTPINDAVAEPTETVLLTLASGTGYTVATPNNATVNIADDEPIVAITASDASASETGPDVGTFTVTRTGSTSSALTVNYALSGSAINGSDYSTLSGSVVIASGQTSAVVTVTPIDDSVAEPTETVTATLSSSATYTIGIPSNATVSIADNEPTITVTSSDTNAAEQGQDTGTFIVTRTNTTGNLTVYYAMSGTATNGSDYSTLSGSVVISSGQSSAAVTLTPIDDSVAEPTESAILTLSTDSHYNVGTPSTATANIADNEPTITVTATDANAAEQGADPGVFTITRTNTNGNLTVYYTVGGTATSGSDFSALSGSMVISSGQTSATVTVTPIDDAVVDANETVVLNLSSNSAYNLGSPSSATVTITDNDASTNSVTYMSTDTTHQGNWKGAYGADGYNIFNSSSSYPTGVTVNFANYGGWTWENPTTDVRGLQKPDPASDRIASCYYNTSTQWTMTVNVGTTTRQIALYGVDWGNQGCQTKIEVMDGSNVLDTQTLSGANYYNGEYVVYRVTGTVTFRFTCLGGPGSAISGIFFDSVSSNSATHLTNDTTTKGSWKGTYGSDGYNVFNYGSPSYPSGVTVNFADYGAWTWENPTTDVRGLQEPDPSSDRIASCYYNTSTQWTMTVNVGLTTRQIALYGVDWGNQGCQTKIEVMDGSNVLDTQTLSGANYYNGEYVVYRVTGTVTFRFTCLGGVGSAISGIFFDPVMAATDNFESGNTSGGSGFSNNWSLGGAASITNAGAPKNGTYHLMLNGTSSSATRAANLTGSTSSHLIFDYKANDFESGETAVVQIYNGTSWITVQTISDGQDDNTYHHSDIDLSSYSLNSGFQVRFLLNGDSDDYFYVDNLRITK